MPGSRMQLINVESKLNPNRRMINIEEGKVWLSQ